MSDWYTDFDERLLELRKRVHWERRLAPSSSYEAFEPPHAQMYTTVILEPRKGRNVEYEVLVCAEYEPPEDGGRDHPSYPHYYYDAQAWYHREGRGWKRLKISPQLRELLEEQLNEKLARNGREYDPD